VYLTNLKDPDGVPSGFPGDSTDFWHSDQEFRESPASVGAFFCLISSASGGSTSFATTAVKNLDLTDEELDEYRPLWSTRRPADNHDNAPRVTVSHPILLANPHTGDEFLYVSKNTIEFKHEHTGKPTTAGPGLKKYLLEKILTRENIISHSWRSGDLILYDNSQLLHRREAFSGIRFLKALKIYPNGKYISAPPGKIVSEELNY
jgi:taurine dioxygenase